MAKIIRRLIGGICIVSALILVQIPAGLSNAASSAKENFLMDNETLVKYTGTATTVSVSDDVKKIGEEAFINNQNLGVINLGKNLKEIDHSAFANCNYLNQVIVPNSVKKIDSAAFSGCDNLIHVSLGDNLEELGDGVFAGCKKLGGISVSRNNNNYCFEAGVLYDKKKEHIYSYLSANPYNIYYMPESVNNISPFSFWGNENLNEVYMSGNLEEIPAYAFSNCKNLKVVQIPSSADSIDAKAFENCISLTDIVIPASVKYIDPSAFDGCYKLNIIADEGTTAYEFFKSFDKSEVATVESQDTNYIVNYGNTTNNEYSNPSSNNNSSNSDGLIDASKDPSNVEWMPSVNPLNSSEDGSIFGKTIIVGGNAFLFVNRDMTVNQVTNEEIEQQLSETNNDDSNVIYDSGKGGYLPKYTYINNNIASHAFYASNNEEDFNIKPGTKKIGDFSFARCTANKVVIPDGVEEIGYGAFYHCDNLVDVIIPSSVKKISRYAFDNTPFKNNNSNGSFWIVGDGILLSYSGHDSNVVVPENVKRISAGCFENNSALVSVSIPDSVIYIDSDAFRGCNNLKDVYGANNVKNIGDRAFMGCPLAGFKVSSSVETIGLRAFDFSDTELNDGQKIIEFMGNVLPKADSDESSKRLSNYAYRQDALYNVVFALLNEEEVELTNTVLDSDKLGFSGVIIKREKDSNGNETGNVIINNCYIYSQEVLDSIPDKVWIDNKEYNLLGKDSITLYKNPYKESVTGKNISIDSNISGVNAVFSEDESVGYLAIYESSEAKEKLYAAYSELFNDEINDLVGYDVNLYSNKGDIPIKKLGKTSLYLTLPVNDNTGKYHAISLDADGQLEELPLTYDSENNEVTFETNHLSYFGIYSTGADNVVLNMKDGKLVKNYRLDDSPETGDKSFSVYYVYSILLVAIGLILILYRKKRY